MTIGTKKQRSEPRLPVPLRLFALLALLFPCSCTWAGNPDQPRMVVVLYPDDYARGGPGSILVDRGIRATFASGLPEDVEIHSEYLDVSRFQNADYQQHLAEFLRRKYAGRKVELIIAGLAPALDFALKHRDEIFPGVPLVFCAVDQGEVKARTLPRDVVGVPIEFDLAATLDVAIRLHPSTAHVFVVAGKTEFDSSWVAEARRAFRTYEDKLEFVYLTGLPMNALLSEVDHLPRDSVIYYLHVHEDGAGKAFVPAEALELIAARANAPIYGNVDTYVGRGLVGGRVFSFEAEGKNAARLGLRILAGEKPEQIGVQQTSENTYVFDGRQLRRWGIRADSLPTGSDVRHQEPSFWESYRWHVIGVVSLCVLETLLIAGLLVQRSSRMRAEKRFRQMVEAAPNGMIMVGQDGTILLANAQMEKLFGYLLEEMLGQTVEKLMPERFRPQHPARRRDFFASPRIRLMGADRALFARRKDGSEFPVEICLSRVRTDEGQFVLASIIDITQRCEAERGLRENQRELRVLTGRLLQAQETERRRIARELHDDLSQGLALLSVQLDLLGQRPGESPAQLAGHVHDLSAQVRQLSSSVHDLSRQLHPTKLEQLGLVAAVSGLCKELGQSHDLRIEFVHRDVPESIPTDTALCLYRIVQEALRNVVKHSGARGADVELSGDADAIRLRVTDDGAGFDPKSVEGKGGLGLVSMRERLRMVRGEIAIDSSPSGGTRVEVHVPVPGAEGAESIWNVEQTTV
jgi:PAS domain S-box-containing protein